MPSAGATPGCHKAAAMKASNWAAQDGYGITDFLVLLDSRTCGMLFKDKGVINQPNCLTNFRPAQKY